MDIVSRIASLEVWAHSFDSVHSSDDGDSAAAVVSATEMVQVRVKQAVADYFAEHPPSHPDISARRPSLVPETPSGVQANDFMLADKIKKLEARLDQLSASVPLTASTTVFTSPGQSSAAEGAEAGSSAAHIRQVQHDQLMQMHTEAISRTWQWTSSLILASMQQRSTNLYVQQTLNELAARSSSSPPAASVSTTQSVIASDLELVQPAVQPAGAGLSDFLTERADEPAQAITPPPDQGATQRSVSAEWPEGPRDASGDTSALNASVPEENVPAALGLENDDAEVPLMVVPSDSD
eukprot:4673125-Amphidinium_carterae.4